MGVVIIIFSTRVALPLATPERFKSGWRDTGICCVARVAGVSACSRRCVFVLSRDHASDYPRSAQPHTAKNGRRPCEEASHVRASEARENGRPAAETSGWQNPARCGHTGAYAQPRSNQKRAPLLNPNLGTTSEATEGCHVSACTVKVLGSASGWPRHCTAARRGEGIRSRCGRPGRVRARPDKVRLGSERCSCHKSRAPVVLGRDFCAGSPVPRYLVRVVLP